MRGPAGDRVPKRRASVSIDRDLLEQAKELKIGLSAALEAKLSELIRIEREKQWLARNREAIADANAFIAKHGVFSDGLRRF